MVFNLKFITSPPQISNRVIGIAKAFGIGVDSTREFPIFDKFIFRYNLTDLIYVSGDSGSGKSCFLRLFAEEQRARERKVLSFETVVPQLGEILIDNVGTNLTTASKLLGIAGLSEPFVMLRQYKELSEGQKYRYRLAKMIDINADVYLIDEFGATLDREMAKVLAFAIQKWARKTQKQIVIASTHHDLIEDFNPNIFVFKGFGQQTLLKYYEYTPRGFSLLNEMKIQEATSEDYDQLHQFHYVAGKPAFVKQRYKLVWRNQIIAIIVYSTPFMQSAGRNRVLPQYKGNADKLNAEVGRIARVIIHPKFRGIGVAHQFIRQCNITSGFRVVEVLAVMPKYNPVFERAGMIRVSETKPNKSQEQIVYFIKAQGFNPSLMFSATERKRFLNQIDSTKMKVFLSLLAANAKAMGGMTKMRGKQIQEWLRKGDIDQAFAQALPRIMVYLYWVNSTFK